MIKTNPIEQLQNLEDRLPYGSKMEIAKKLATSEGEWKKYKQNVQAAFRGLASIEFTEKVLRQAHKILAKRSMRKIKVVRRITVMQ